MVSYNSVSLIKRAGFINSDFTPELRVMGFPEEEPESEMPLQLKIIDMGQLKK